VVPVGAMRARHQYLVPLVSPEAMTDVTPLGRLVWVVLQTMVVNVESLATSKATSELPPALLSTSTTRATAKAGVLFPSSGDKATTAYWATAAAALKRNAGNVPDPAPSRFATGLALLAYGQRPGGDSGHVPGPGHGYGGSQRPAVKQRPAR
jgi:hypothetical protein